MTRHERFVRIVEAGAVVRDIQGGRTLAVHVIDFAARLSEEALPPNIEAAAEEYLSYQYQKPVQGGRNAIPPPAWLPEWTDEPEEPEEEEE